MLQPRSSNSGLPAGRQGVSVIEILIVVFILSSALASLLGLINLALGASGLASQNLRAAALAQESMETVRNVRDNAGWSQLVIGSTVESIDIFTRTVLTEAVRRDGSDNIVESGGVIDPNTKKITVAVSWQGRGRSHEIRLAAYLTNWR